MMQSVVLAKNMLQIAAISVVINDANATDEGVFSAFEYNRFRNVMLVRQRRRCAITTSSWCVPQVRRNYQNPWNRYAWRTWVLLKLW